MSKKKRTQIMTVGTAVLLIFCVVLYLREDRKGPLIQIDDSVEMVYKTGDSEEMLLSGITAIDEKDGDVSDTLRIEHVIQDAENCQIIVSYVARDYSNNVTKQRRWIPWEIEEASSEQKNK